MGGSSIRKSCHSDEIEAWERDVLRLFYFKQLAGIFRWIGMVAASGPATTADSSIRNDWTFDESFPYLPFIKGGWAKDGGGFYEASADTGMAYDIAGPNTLVGRKNFNQR
jgi:hypothetical protein